MSKIIILNQEINTSEWDAQDDMVASLKVRFIKSCLLEILSKFITQPGSPPEFVGFILHFMGEIGKDDIQSFSDEDLSFWLLDKIGIIKKRELSHPYWNARMPLEKKLSFNMAQLRIRLFSSGEVEGIRSAESKELQAIISNAKKEMQDKILLEIDIKRKQRIQHILQKAMSLYEKSCFWPISDERHAKKQELLLLINSASNADDAIKILSDNIMLIEQQYILKSCSANLAFYQRKSRFVAHLCDALSEIKNEQLTSIPLQKTSTELEVQVAIAAYLSDDIFYHNRQRRYIANRLLMQLRQDALTFSQDPLACKYKMRSTLDEYINQIDNEFKNTHFFSKYFPKRRSRLAANLEVAKQRLINNHDLPELDLESQIKQPILKEINTMMSGVENLDVDSKRHLNTLCDVIKNAQTPEAIESIIEGHIRSLKQSYDQTFDTHWWVTLKNMLTQEKDIYPVMAFKLEDALLIWQTNGLLPSTSGYKTFLQTLAEQRQNHENEIQQFEQRYNIKVPRSSPEKVREQCAQTRQKAMSLLNRISV